MVDGDFKQGEYDVYCDFCRAINRAPLTVDECRTLYNENIDSKIHNKIIFMKKIRVIVNPEDYSKFIEGLCYISLMGTRKFHEYEFYYLKNFFIEGYDYIGTDWEKFKKQW